MAEHRLVPVRLRDRNCDRGLARDRAAHHDGNDPPGHLLAVAGGRADHAVGRVLRRAVRGLDHRHPRQDPRRDLLGHHRAGRPRHGAGRPCRPGARDRGARIAVRGIGGDAADRDRRPAARQDRAAVSIGGLRLRHVARPGVRRGARARLGAQGHRHDRARCHAGPRRHRCVDRRVPDDHGPRRSLRRHRIRSAVDGPVRIGRDHGQSRSCNGRRRAGQDGQRTVADARRSQAIVPSPWCAAP